MTCQQHGNGPCKVPPHPDLAAQLQAAALEHPDDPSVTRAPSGAPTGSAAGINEGIILPPAELDGPEGRTLPQRTALARPAPLRGAIRAAVILVDFPDRPMAANAAQRFRDLFFSKGVISTGSATEYYADVSNNKISLTGEVLGPYRMPRRLTEYANNSFGYGGSAPNTQTMAWDAVNAADPNINFNPYDNDGNGYVDAFIVVHAGTGAEQSNNKNDIWSVQWNLTSARNVDKTKIYGFLTLPEDANVGVCCHELGHLLFGWPDLYDTDYSSRGIGNWCLMAAGSWGGLPAGTRPVHPSAWCKVQQGWVDVDGEYWTRDATIQDVKTSRRVSRMWNGGRSNTQEYFLVENRQRTGFDSSMPASGLLVWHVDDSIKSNADENHPKVALMQADGLNNLGTNSNSGDSGDVFPGTSSKKDFNQWTNPSSRAYGGKNTNVSISNIAVSGANITARLMVHKPGFEPVYAQGSPGSGIAGYDLADRRDQAIAFDWDGQGKMDHIVLFRPGNGNIWVVGSFNGTWSAKFASQSGAGGYDLLDANDQAIAFDYTSSGKNDHLVLYRPGGGACYIVRRNDNDIVPVWSSHNGIGGFDLAEGWDRMFAFDYNSSGKLDHLCLFRPNGTFWIVRNNGGSFEAVYASGSGIGGYDMAASVDQAFAFDWNKSGCQDHIVLYRPGSGIIWCVRRNGSNWEAVMANGGQGIGGFNLVSPNDRAFACDYSGRGRQDQIAFYRPGTGTLWILDKNSANEWGAIWADGDPGDGFGNFDLGSVDDRMFAFDYDHSGKKNFFVVYRKDGSGTIWIQKPTP